MGTTSSSSAHWDGSAMPSQHGKIAIVTGANSGIGFFTARELARSGAHVILACRSESRGRTAEQDMATYLQQLPTEGQGSVAFMQVDMGNLASVRAFAGTVRRTHRRVDLLINNAGVALPPQPLTADGIESHFGVNHVSHFLLTTLLFDLLRAAPHARVVNVSSREHSKATSMEFDTLVKHTDHPWARYGKSKLANLLFTYELARRLETGNISNVMSVAAHPGVSYTAAYDKMIASVFPGFLVPLIGWIVKAAPMQSSEMGALPTLYAATAPEVANGEYFGPHALGGFRGYPVKEQSRPQSHNKAEAARLWTLSEELTAERFVVAE